MGETIVKKLRGKLTGLAAAAAVFAIIGAAGIFVIKGLVISEVIKPTGGMSNVGTIMLYSAIALLWDITRLGGFGMFVCGVLAVISELLGGARGKLYAFIMLAGSVCGLVAAIQFSIQNIFRSLMNAAIRMGASGSAVGSMSTAYIDLPCILAIISSVVVFVALAIKSMNASRVYIEPQYSQQYPQQGYPQQGYPQYPQGSTMPTVGVDLAKPEDNNTTNNMQ